MAQDTKAHGKGQSRQTSEAVADIGAARQADESKATAAKANDEPQESKAERFKRLANRRVPKAVKALSHIANLGNAHQYEYTSEQVSKIIDAIRAAADDLERAFKGGGQKVNGWSL